MTDIAMEWDGTTKEAVLWLNGDPMRGEPRAVRRAFESLCALRDMNHTRGLLLDNLVQVARTMEREVEKVRAKERAP